MNFGNIIKEIGRGAQGARHLAREEACDLYAAMLDGGVPDLELGAIVLSLRVKGESLDEMLGFQEAARRRTNRLALPGGSVRPVVLPSYNGARKEANLTPLLALLLQRFGVPVLMHGLLEGYGRVTTPLVLRELGVLPSPSPQQAQTTLASHGVAFLPLAALSPGLHQLIALRARLGVRNSAHSLVKLLHPFDGEAVLVAPGTHPDFIALMRDLMLQSGDCGLLLRGSEGEPFANPRRRPRMELVREGGGEVLFEAEHDSVRSLPHLPESVDAAATAAWIRRVLDGELPVPKPIANQLACCLYACGVAVDLNQAKAIVAVETIGLSAGGN